MKDKNHSDLVRWPSKLTALENGLAGATSSFMTRALLQPLDVLKIRFQLQVEPTYGKNSGLYKGVLQAIRTIHKNEGFCSLWKGHVAAQVLTITYGAGQFWSYSFFTKKATKYGYENNGFATMACGGLAGLVGTLMSMPFDVSRTRLIAQGFPKYKGLLDVWRQMIREEGFVSLWKGVGPTLAMTVPFAAIQFRLYYFLSNRFQDKLKENELSITGTSRSALFGATSGLCAKMVVYPLDVLKKRMQIRGSEYCRENLGKVSVYKNSFDCILKLTKHEGILGWFKGLSPSLIKSAAFSGLIFAFYDLTCQLIVHSHDDLSQDKS